jgi:integral membrane protein (TIGR01906 family)
VTDSLGRGASVAIGLATGVVIVAVSLVPFLNPVWVAFEQGRSGALAATGFTPQELRTASDAILADLLIGPPEFDVTIRGQPVLNERERGHMRDVRGVFAGLGLITLAAVGTLVGGWLLTRGRAAARAGYRYAVRRGATGLAVGVVVAGVASLVAFDAVFEAFHRVFFAGNYTFDPRTERLVQLFPIGFWSETAIAVGGVILVLALGVRTTVRPGPGQPSGPTAVPVRAAG